MSKNIYLDNFTTALQDSIDDDDTALDLGSGEYARLRGLVDDYSGLTEDTTDIYTIDPGGDGRLHLALDNGTDCELVRVLSFNDADELVNVSRDANSRGAHAFSAGVVVEARVSSEMLEGLESDANSETDAKFYAHTWAGTGANSILTTDVEASTLPFSYNSRTFTLPDSGAMVVTLDDMSAVSVPFDSSGSTFINYFAEINFHLTGTGSVEFVAGAGVDVESVDVNRVLDTQWGRVTALWDPNGPRWILYPSVPLSA